MVAANARTAITFALSPGQASDAVEGRDLLAGIGPLPAPLHLIMDAAYDDNTTLQLVLDFGSSQSCHPGIIVSSLGNWTGLCTANNEAGEALSQTEASAASSRASRNSTGFLGFITSPDRGSPSIAI